MIGVEVSKGLGPTHTPSSLPPCGDLEASLEKKEIVDSIGRVLLSFYLGGGQKSAIHTRQAGDAV